MKNKIHPLLILMTLGSKLVPLNISSSNSIFSGSTNNGLDLNHPSISAIFQTLGIWLPSHY